jgi:hypothetical protein
VREEAVSVVIVDRQAHVTILVGALLTTSFVVPKAAL